MWEEWNEAQREALRELKAAVWDEGWSAGWDDCSAWVENRDLDMPNPYRKATQ